MNTHKFPFIASVMAVLCLALQSWAVVAHSVKTNRPLVLPLTLRDTNAPTLRSAAIPGNPTLDTAAPLTVANNTFVGVNIDTPQYRLDVNGLSTGNPIRLRGLQKGTLMDSLITSKDGVLRRLPIDSVRMIEEFNKITRIGQPSNSTERGVWNPIYTAIAASKPLFDDEEFVNGSNSVNVYNNAGGTGVKHFWEVGDVTVPNSSGKWIRIVNDGSGGTSPDLGGFYQAFMAKRNTTFVQRFRAKVPVGYRVALAENYQGDGYTSYFLTSTEGTGKWEEYIRVAQSGTTGPLSTSGHIYIQKTTATSNVFTWYLASCNTYEVEKSNANTGEFNKITRIGQPSNSTERGVWNPIYTAIAASKPLFDDEEFVNGINALNVYNNAGGTGVKHFWEVGDVTVPNSSGKWIRIVNDGSGGTSPDLGGFYQSFIPKRNVTFVQRFRAKIPIGYKVVLAENYQGAGSTSYFLTATEGTGKWEEYIRVSQSGTTGPYGDGGYIYIQKTTATSNVFTWYLASCNTYEVESTFKVLPSQVATGTATDVGRLLQMDANGRGTLVSPTNIRSGAYRLSKSIQKVIPITTSSNQGKYFDIGTVAMGSMEGVFTVNLLFSGGGFGQSATYRIPTSYYFDYTNAYNLIGARSGWVVVRPQSSSPRHLLPTESSWDLLMNISANTLQFRVRISGAADANGSICYVGMMHSNEFDNVTYTELNTTGTDASAYPELPNILSGTEGNSVIQNTLLTSKLGVGTNTPVSKLNVVGSNGAGQGIQMDNGEIKMRGDGYAHYSIFNKNGLLSINNTSSDLATGVTGANLVSVASNGNVGIGTASPQYKLDIINNFRIGAQGGLDVTVIEGGSGYGSQIKQYYTDGTIKNLFSANGNSYINAGGLGIGTTTPTQKLDVIGNVKATNILLTNIPAYANDAAADADANLPSGALYKITGSRQVFQKP